MIALNNILELLVEGTSLLMKNTFGCSLLLMGP
jgi:hypothetical protein